MFLFAYRSLLNYYSDGLRSGSKSGGDGDSGKKERSLVCIISHILMFCLPIDRFSSTTVTVFALAPEAAAARGILGKRNVASTY